MQCFIKIIFSRYYSKVDIYEINVYYKDISLVCLSLIILSSKKLYEFSENVNLTKV